MECRESLQEPQPESLNPMRVRLDFALKNNPLTSEFFRYRKIRTTLKCIVAGLDKNKLNLHTKKEISGLD